MLFPLLKFLEISEMGEIYISRPKREQSPLPLRGAKGGARTEVMILICMSDVYYTYV